jgi:hypothetical protein
VIWRAAKERNHLGTGSNTTPSDLVSGELGIYTIYTNTYGVDNHDFGGREKRAMDTRFAFSPRVVCRCLITTRENLTLLVASDGALCLLVFDHDAWESGDAHAFLALSRARVSRAVTRTSVSGVPAFGSIISRAAQATQ